MKSDSNEVDEAHLDDTDETSSSEESSDEQSDYNVMKKHKRIMSPAFQQYWTNTRIQKSTMILASVLNEAGPSTSASVLSKSRKTANEIKKNFQASKCVGMASSYQKLIQLSKLIGYTS